MPRRDAARCAATRFATVTHVTLTLDSTIDLRGGVAIPRLGLGVYQSRPGDETRMAVRHALELGYRHIDTASAYGNESDVGEAIRESGIARERIFVTTKVWNRDHGYDATLRACRASLRQLRMEYVDLYLIHWPVARLRAETWRALATLQADGLCRAIGVSNYTVRHLRELIDRGDPTDPIDREDAVPVPAVNQVEFSPFLYQRELLAFCRQHDIALEAYSPLAQAQRLDDPRLVQLAQRHGKSAAQVMLRWALQRDVVVIPKSVRRSRIAENADIFDFALDENEMAQLDGLHDDFRVCWDPTRAP